MSFLVFLLISLGFLSCGFLEIASTTGVDVLLQILWTFFSTVSSSTYSKSFGEEPVKTMTKILFVRHIVFNITTLYFDRQKRVFSKRVAEYMAGAYAVSALLGMFGFVHMSEDALRLFLGISSLVFLALTVLHLGKKIMDNRKKRAELRDNGVPVSRECDFLTTERPSMFAGGKPGSTGFVSRTPFVFPRNWKDGEAPGGVQDGTSSNGGVNNDGAGSGAGNAVPSGGGGGLMGSSLTARRWGGNSSRPPPLSEAFLSAVTNEIFYASEAGAPEIREDFVPALTPQKLSPSGTMIFTHVRVNRVLRDGFIGKWYWMAGIATGVVAGLWSSLVGVSSPVIFLFISTLDLPSYLFMNIIAAHEIPGSVIRFLLALYSGVYTGTDIVLILQFIVFYLAGMYLARSFGDKGLGHRSTWLYFCGLLLCQASILISRSSQTLLLALLVCFAVVSVSTYLEKSRVKLQLQFHYEVQQQREQRQRQALEELQRDHSHILQRMKGEEVTAPYWAGYDNDDDREYPVKSPIHREALASEAPPKDLPPHTLDTEHHSLETPVSSASLKSCEEVPEDHFAGTAVVELDNERAPALPGREGTNSDGIGVRIDARE